MTDDNTQRDIEAEGQRAKRLIEHTSNHNEARQSINRADRALKIIGAIPNCSDAMLTKLEYDLGFNR